MALRKTRVVLVSVVSNALLIVFKIAAGVVMGSVAVISEAVHSGIDLLAAVVAYIAVRMAEKPADDEHPFGHGKFENISGFFEALLIFAAAGLIIYEAARKLFYSFEVENLDWGMGVMAVSATVNFFVSRILFSAAKKHGSIAIEADALHLWTDVFTSVGVLFGLLLIRLTGWHILDPVIAIVVAGLILKASIDLTARSIGDLADNRLPDSEMETIRTVVGRFPEVTGYHKLRTRRSGSRREIDVHIKIDGNATVAAAHGLSFRIETAIKKELPGAYVTIHMEPAPCGPRT
jgi:cation diffusion facilitator family transporter